MLVGLSKPFNLECVMVLHGLHLHIIAEGRFVLLTVVLATLSQMFCVFFYFIFPVYLHESLANGCAYPNFCRNSIE